MHVEASSTQPRSRLEDALALLDPRSCQVMRLWLEGAAPGEIAATLGLSERNVMVIRGSSLWKLRDLIGRQPNPETREELELLEISGTHPQADQGCPRR
jgi:DNA-binding CsgD family transcriptional regulator